MSSKTSKFTRAGKARAAKSTKPRPAPAPDLTDMCDELATIRSAAAVCMDAAAEHGQDDLAVVILTHIVLPLRAFLKRLDALNKEGRP